VQNLSPFHTLNLHPLWALFDLFFRTILQFCSLLFIFAFFSLRCLLLDVNSFALIRSVPRPPLNYSNLSFLLSNFPSFTHLFYSFPLAQRVPFLRQDLNPFLSFFCNTSHSLSPSSDLSPFLCIHTSEPQSPSPLATPYFVR